MSYILIYSPKLDTEEIERSKNLTTDKNLEKLDASKINVLTKCFDEGEYYFDNKDCSMLVTNNKKNLTLLCLANDKIKLAIKNTDKFSKALLVADNLLDMFSNIDDIAFSLLDVIEAGEEFNTGIFADVIDINYPSVGDFHQQSYDNRISIFKKIDSMIAELKCYPL